MRKKHRRMISNIKKTASFLFSPFTVLFTFRFEIVEPTVTPEEAYSKVDHNNLDRSGGFGKTAELKQKSIENTENECYIVDGTLKNMSRRYKNV